ncbi:MAG: hypothetical protein LH471_09710 [Salinibacterium sp.]|nr:hypothetical protein [Salinibacterium sp.]
MQLGTRWRVGSSPPTRLAESVLAAIAEVEGELAAVDTAGWSWTLTWLEGRPVVELDDGTSIRVDHEGAVSVLGPDGA